MARRGIVVKLEPKRKSRFLRHDEKMWDCGGEVSRIS